jgi:aminoglycoside phosphotransferase (APT) family kinase protein
MAKWDFRIIMKDIPIRDEVINTLKSEYPELSSYDLAIRKQFSSTDGRKYRVYLIEAPNSPWKEFIAKSNWNEQHDVADEARILKILSSRNVDAALPIVPYREGSRFILLRYIKGTNAREVLQDTSRVTEVYANIGTTLKEIYSVPVPGFGKFWRDPAIEWVDYVDEKFNERLTSNIEGGLHNGIQKIYAESRDDIVKDGNEGPVLIHRDTYTDNFIIEDGTGKAVLIDFAMAVGGRPFFDIAKLYLVDLLKEPEGQGPFLEALSVKRDEGELNMLRAFIVIELMGMVNFFDSIGDEKMTKFAENTLRDVVEDKGKITEVLGGFMK